MKWYKWLGTFSSEKETIRTKNLLVHSNIPHKCTKVKEFKNIIPNIIWFLWNYNPLLMYNKNIYC